MSKSITITRLTAINLGLSSVTVVKHTQVGPNRIHQPCTQAYNYNNNLNGLCHSPKKKCR